jgi:N-acetylglutamate synthase-like GNAT family acetyltransferase
MLPPGPIVTLAYRIPLDRRPELFAFLRDAVPFYEQPGGSRVGLYESADEPGLFLELVAYADEAAYAADQERVEHDAEMIAVLGRFRAVVGGATEVRRMKPVPELDRPPIAGPGGSVRIEPAAFNDHAGIGELLAQAALPLPGTEDAPVRMLVARGGAGVAGCAGWERHGAVALLRSVAVRLEERRKHLGRALVRAALSRIEAEGAREVVLLTTGATQFFASLGFARIEREALAEEVRSACQVATQCCEGAVSMRLALPCSI